MDGRAASHTITDKIPHLLAAGIELVVISGVTGRHDDRFEHHQVWSWGPSGFKFELRHVLKQKISSKLGYRISMLLMSLILLPLIFIERLFKPVESSWSWCFSANHLGRRLARQKPFDLIYSTAGPFAAHLAAQSLKRTLKAPWLAEIHDPLVLPGTIPATRRQKAYADVERRICEDADIAIWFTDQALESARKRHPILGNKGRVLLPGVDNPFENNLPEYKRQQKLIVGHFGSLSATRTLLPFINALALLKNKYPDSYKDLEIHIYGGQLDEISTRLSLELKVTDHLIQHGRLEKDSASGLSGRDQVLIQMRQCDILALVHGDDPMCSEYIPSKLYEYLWMQRPIVATVHDNPQMERILDEQGHNVVDFSQRNGGRASEVAACGCEHLYRHWQDWKSKGISYTKHITPYTSLAATSQVIGFAQEIFVK
mgnify:FL=1